MRRFYLLSFLPLLAFQTGCTHREACAGVHLADAAANIAVLASITNPEQEATTADDDPGPEQPVVMVPVVRPIPPHEPASKADVPEAERKPFDLGAAYGAIARVDLSQCKAAGLAGGYGKVVVAFDRGGAPLAVGVELPPGSAPAAQTCVTNAFQSVHVAAYDGELVNVRRTFYVS